jgi:hypothetical protein
VSVEHVTSARQWLRERVEVRRRQLARERDPDEREALERVIAKLEATLDEHVLAEIVDRPDGII